MALSLYRNSLLIRYGNFMFRYRNMAFPVCLAVLLIAFPPVGQDGGGRLDVWVGGTALAVALAGEALRILTVGLEYIKRGGLNKRVYAENLVTNGLFAHCRNPLYVGNLMIALAVLALPGRIDLFLVGGVLVALTYVAIVAAEERYLREKFGDGYEAYCRDTNRWFPDLRGLGATIASMKFNWRRVLLKESSSFYGWIAAVFVVGGIKTEFSVGRPDFVLFAVLFAAGTVAFATIRVLKQTRRLHL